MVKELPIVRPGRSRFSLAAQIGMTLGRDSLAFQSAFVLM
jgi:hypothetical protein